jgi:hypothetical protein
MVECLCRQWEALSSNPGITLPSPPKKRTWLLCRGLHIGVLQLKMTVLS